MAQKLTNKVERETTATIFSKGKHRPIIVTITPNNLIEMRLKGLRQCYTVPVDALFDRTMQIEVASTLQKRRRR